MKNAKKRVQGHLLVCNRDGGSGWPNPHHLHVTATVTIAVAIAIAVTLTLPAIAVVVGRGKGGALSGDDAAATRLGSRRHRNVLGLRLLSLGLCDSSSSQQAAHAHKGAVFVALNGDVHKWLMVPGYPTFLLSVRELRGKRVHAFADGDPELLEAAVEAPVRVVPARMEAEVDVEAKAATAAAGGVCGLAEEAAAAPAVV